MCPLTPSGGGHGILLPHLRVLQSPPEAPLPPLLPPTDGSDPRTFPSGLNKRQYKWMHEEMAWEKELVERIAVGGTIVVEGEAAAVEGEAKASLAPFCSPWLFGSGPPLPPPPRPPRTRMMNPTSRTIGADVAAVVAAEQGRSWPLRRHPPLGHPPLKGCKAVDSTITASRVGADEGAGAIREGFGSEGTGEVGEDGGIDTIVAEGMEVEEENEGEEGKLGGEGVEEGGGGLGF